ncbi:MAG TPA: hypothetical protein VFC08_05310 [Actinomycetota bacterium]|nr:hypothetical protein [Actinomycetota bacterium]
MAVQGASLQRQGHLPVWPILGLVVLALAAAIGLTVLNEVRTTAPATTTQPVVPVVVPQSAIWASSAAIRERAATPFHSTGRAHEVILGGQSSVITYANGLENPGGYVTASLSKATAGQGFGDCDHCHQRR